MTTPYEVREIIAAELGCSVESIFRRFEHTPLASASLAQVHEAELLSGERVAVKVQHAGLQASADADIATIGSVAIPFTRLLPRNHTLPVVS